MKLILLQHLSGVKGTFEVGEEIEVSNDTTILAYIKKGIAKPKTEKALKDFMNKSKEIEDAEANKKAQAKAILESDRLKAELQALYTQVVFKESELLGVVFSDEEIVSEVETLLTRVKKES